jgi:hypothetical protein
LNVYLDSSVILRRVLGQPGALAEWADIRAGVASSLVEVECLRTLDRFRLRRQIADAEIAARRAAVYRLLESVELVDLDRILLARASQPMPTELGTLDAIHLNTALLWRERRAADLVMATHDIALGTAARASGLRVVGLS